MLNIAVITLFPEMFASLLSSGVTGRAFTANFAKLNTLNPRDYTSNKHQAVDDRPFGGGPGMVMQVEPLQRTIHKAKEQMPNAHVIHFSPQGKQLTQSSLNSLLARENLIMIASRYEGVDERLIELEVDEEWSIGDYVLTGGELAAMVTIDAMVRLIPGVLGHEESAVQESFTHGLLDCPHFTRPRVYQGIPVPEVLCSGDHQRIATWRLKQSLGRTYERRPDLLQQYSLTKQEKKLLEEYLADKNEF